MKFGRISGLLATIVVTGALFVTPPSTMVSTATVHPQIAPVALAEPIPCGADQLCPDDGTYLPTPCGATTPDESILERRARYVVVHDGAHFGYSHTVTLHRGDGARDYLHRLKDEIRRCGPSIHDGVQTTYRLRSARGDKLVVELRWKDLTDMPFGPTSGTHLILIQRIHDHVVVIRDDGWEGQPSPRSTLDRALQNPFAGMPTA